jgi:hypothetical protein
VVVLGLETHERPVVEQRSEMLDDAVGVADAMGDDLAERPEGVAC